jgi:hypothetical protein
VNVANIVEVSESISLDPGEVNSVTAVCPDGYAVLSGGHIYVALGGFVFFEQSFGGVGWGVGADNTVSDSGATLTATARCVPSGTSATPSTSTSQREAQLLVQRERALHSPR